MRKSLLNALCPLLLIACHSATVTPASRSAPPARFLKGQTHLHSNNSGDSQTPPDEVARWYKEHGYDFIVFTDHNYVTELKTEDLLVIGGAELTQNLRTCSPAPPPGLACLLHINALFVDSPAPMKIPWPEEESKERLALFGRALGATRALGGIAQLNHPNFHYAADAELILALAKGGLVLMEIANQSHDSNDAGDETHPPTEALWDKALTAGAMIYGVATDDAHHYYDAGSAKTLGTPVFPGDLGFIMVQAKKDAASIREAISRGDFYSSTGLLLEGLSISREAMEIWVAAESGRSYRITFIGTGGKILAEVKGASARFDLSRAKKGYVRARVEDDLGRRAWIQPVRVP